ncbi:hypothetical protein HPP92_014852 [Vanilla planifolia]|uniref:DnaJ homologue subfamily C GRV2/DNAJC13 N-terminal domain-containing protein n=1 Tax=Vanilla planifolia TaxID=51239 RepID=A0A835QMD4_VANPL|nr:hypothetical protein HPP92_014852 [Vanilla planifolia]
MDFVSRHATSSSADQHHPSSSAVETALPPARPVTVASGPAVPEEPEYLARYMVVKHSWRGRYKRILCISTSAITTLDPATLAVTNSYDVLVTTRGGAGSGPGTEGRGKFKAIKLSSRYRVSILTELHLLRLGKLDQVAEFQVLHLRRRNSQWVPYKLKVTAVGVELIEANSGNTRWCLDFRDMDSPAVILLADKYGKRSTDQEGFLLCPLYGRKIKAFTAGSGTTNSTIIAHLIKMARSLVGLLLTVDSSQSLTVADFLKQRAKQAVGGDETPHGEWSVTRLRSPAHGTANLLGLGITIGPKGGLGEHGDSVSRQLVLHGFAD